MFPPRNCDQCLCIKKVWRSQRSLSGVWGPPTLISEEYWIDCDNGSSWRLISDCVAEYVQYDRCDKEGSPEGPSIPAPDCEILSEPCPECCGESPVTSATLDIPANWGFLLSTGVPALPAACWYPADEACSGTYPFMAPVNPEATCDGCEDITARTIVFDFVEDSLTCATVFSACSDSLFPYGTFCKDRYMTWADTFQCCSPSQYSFGKYGTNNNNMAYCARIGLAKHADDASCRVYLFLSMTVGMNCGFSGTNSLQRGTRVYASDLLGGDCCGTFTLTDSRLRGATPIAGDCGDLCNAMPNSFDVTLSC